MNTTDRSRRFNLPGIHELNKCQDAALALPLEGQHLIVGGPGTGKSVVALLRATQLSGDAHQYKFLAFNSLLDQSSQYLFGSEVPLRSVTLEKGFCNLWRKVFSDVVPRFPQDNKSNYRNIDWKSVARISQRPPAEWDRIVQSKRLPFLIIDEGQDMPPAFYQTLVNLGFSNYYIVADQNQQIHPDSCSSRQDIENSLAIESSDTVQLTTNFRNSRPIALLAQHFYPGDLASPRPDLPADNHMAAIPELWTYGTSKSPCLGDISVLLLKASDRDPKRLIGVITPDNKVRDSFVTALQASNPKLDNEKPPIQTYSSGSKNILDFGNGGIMVINAQACKGLEFDMVVLADIDKHQPNYRPEDIKKRFYVMIARARYQVILLRNGNDKDILEQILPTDTNVLARR